MVDAAPAVYRSGLNDSSRWRGFSLRPDDIVISVPSKCGTTWVQMICALLIFQRTDLPGALTTVSPWLDMCLRPVADVTRALEAQRHRRFIKTHTPLDGLPRQMRHLADRLGIEVPRARWPALVEAAGFAAMRARADRLAPDERLGLFTSRDAFFRSGQAGQWRDLLGDEDLAAYRTLIRSLAGTDFIHRAENGTNGGRLWM